MRKLKYKEVIISVAENKKKLVTYHFMFNYNMNTDKSGSKAYYLNWTGCSLQGGFIMLCNEFKLSYMMCMAYC